MTTQHIHTFRSDGPASGSHATPLTLPLKIHLNGVDVGANWPHVLVHAHAPGVDLLRVHTVLGVQVLNLAIRVHPSRKIRVREQPK